MICPACHNQIEYDAASTMQLTCNCQPNKRASFRCLFKVGSPYSELDNFSVLLWLHPIAQSSEQFYRITYFWRCDNLWQITLYTQKAQLLAEGHGYHSPEEAWSLLQRYKNFLTFL